MRRLWPQPLNEPELPWREVRTVSLACAPEDTPVNCRTAETRISQEVSVLIFLCIEYSYDVSLGAIECSLRTLQTRSCELAPSPNI